MVFDRLLIGSDCDSLVYLLLNINSIYLFVASGSYKV